jgi:hypothetical protein
MRKSTGSWGHFIGPRLTPLSGETCKGLIAGDLGTRKVNGTARGLQPRCEREQRTRRSKAENVPPTEISCRSNVSDLNDDRPIRLECQSHTSLD